MELARGFRAKNRRMSGASLLDNRILIRLPSPQLLRAITRSLLLAIVIASMPWLGRTILGSSSWVANSNSGFTELHQMDDAFWFVLFGDLTNKGLIKSDDRALYIGSGETSLHHHSKILKEKEMDFVSEFDIERQLSIPDETFDFVFADTFHAAEFIWRTIKTNGIVAVRMNNGDHSFFKPQNLKIVYIRQFDSTIVAMKKTSSVQSPATRRLFAADSNAKRAALDHLEDVLLEPPRVVKESNNYLRRTKYLPDLTGDSLDGYPRRVFIDVGSLDRKTRSTEWFVRHYPRRNYDFEIFEVETVAEAPPSGLGMSEWLRRNVREDEYVVMKAEAEVVDEMVNSKVVGLVDELFLECRHRGQRGNNSKSRRAYWECLALYGRLRDQGVAVHQWWG